MWTAYRLVYVRYAHLDVYDGVVSRTNIDLDDDLVERAMRRYRLGSKRAAVQLALERLVGDPMSTEEILAMEGAGYPLDNDDLEGGDDAVDLTGIDVPGPR
jgi:Arc/MetJ family transcription regulator